jgi:hypothetical protein
MDLKKQIIECTGFDPDNESDCLEMVIRDGYSIKYIKNPSVELQKLAIKSSRYNLAVIAMCPDWKEFEQEIIDNLMIKDIIE